MALQRVPKTIRSARGEPTVQRHHLDVEPRVLVEQADQVTKQAVGTGVPRLAVEAEARYLVEINSQVVVQSATMVTTVTRVKRVEELSGRTAAELEGRRVQLRGMTGLYGMADEMTMAVVDSRAVVGSRGRAERALLKDLVQRILSGQEPELERLHPGIRDKVKARWKPIEMAEAKYADAAAARADKTRQETRRAKEQLAAAERKGSVLRTLLDIQAGRKVTSAQAAEAVQAYEDGQATDASPVLDSEDQRSRSR